MEHKINPDSHIYLYSKGFYRYGDVKEDLKKIIGERCGLPPELVSLSDITVVLKELIWKHMNRHKFFEFVDRMNENHYVNSNSKNDFHSLFFNSAISSLLLLEASQIEGELSFPTSKILPLSFFDREVEKPKVSYLDPGRNKPNHAYLGTYGGLCFSASFNYLDEYDIRKYFLENKINTSDYEENIFKHQVGKTDCINITIYGARRPWKNKKDKSLCKKTFNFVFGKYNKINYLNMISEVFYEYQERKNK